MITPAAVIEWVWDDGTLSWDSNILWDNPARPIAVDLDPATHESKATATLPATVRSAGVPVGITLVPVAQPLQATGTLQAIISFPTRPISGITYEAQFHVPPPPARAVRSAFGATGYQRILTTSARMSRRRNLLTPK